MNCHQYNNSQWTQIREEMPVVDEQSIYWFDFTLEETDWYEKIYQLTGLVIHENHIRDSFNAEHPPKCEIGIDYEYLIMPILHDAKLQSINLTACSFFFTDSFLVSIHSEHSTFNEKVFERLQKPNVAGRSRNTSSIPGLLHYLLNLTINLQMDIRTELNEVMAVWQDKLMSRKIKSEGWSDYYQLQRDLNKLAINTELQTDVLSRWEKETEIELTEHQQIRFKDLSDHLERVARHLKDLRQDSDHLLQIYFSITQEKTNRVVQLLTAISVIFLPLHLIAGLFGMNIAAMPLQNVANGFWYVLAGMASIAFVFFVLLMLKFRSK